MDRISDAAQSLATVGGLSLLISAASLVLALLAWRYAKAAEHRAAKPEVRIVAVRQVPDPFPLHVDISSSADVDELTCTLSKPPGGPFTDQRFWHAAAIAPLGTVTGDSHTVRTNGLPLRAGTTITVGLRPAAGPFDFDEPARAILRCESRIGRMTWTHELDTGQHYLQPRR